MFRCLVVDDRNGGGTRDNGANSRGEYFPRSARRNRTPVHPFTRAQHAGGKTNKWELWEGEGWGKGRGKVIRSSQCFVSVLEHTPLPRACLPQSEPLSTAKRARLILESILRWSPSTSSCWRWSCVLLLARMPTEPLTGPLVARLGGDDPSSCPSRVSLTL
jgi:hypothetical protein